jgi:hypothetical protein
LAVDALGVDVPDAGVLEVGAALKVGRAESGSVVVGNDSGCIELLEASRLKGAAARVFCAVFARLGCGGSGCSASDADGGSGVVATTVARIMESAAGRCLVGRLL